jgi:hypothetical protein
MATTVPYSDLATGVNQFMTGEAMKPYLANLPNYANMVGSRTEGITQQLKGQLPQDVINQIGQQAAERGISGGSPGSPNANAAYLRSLGLNSLQMQQQGQQNLSSAIADTPVPELWNPMALHIPELLAKKESAAARSAAFMQQPQASGGGGIQYTGQVSGLGKSEPIPRYSAPIMQAMGPGANSLLDRGVQFDTALPQSSYDNWWDSYGVTAPQQQSQAYWDSPAGLQDPMRPADEAPYIDDMEFWDSYDN